jgi:hypothetical protein
MPWKKLGTDAVEELGLDAVHTQSISPDPWVNATAAARSAPEKSCWRSIRERGKGWVSHPDLRANPNA